jgi:hypothetical protein
MLKWRGRSVPAEETTKRTSWTMPAAFMHVPLMTTVGSARTILGSGSDPEPVVRFAAVGGLDFTLLLLLAAIAAAVGLAYRRLRTRAQPEDDDSLQELPPLVFPVSGQPPRPKPTAGQVSTKKVARGSTAREKPGEAAEAVPRPQPQGNANGRPVIASETDMADTTLQLLPGRLEVVSGETGAAEIRFVRPSGKDPVFTLGRSAGEPPAHVQLANPTVSRMHACLRYKDGNWRIVNLSRTNPAVVNGQALPIDGGERALQDGDRLELGEIVLRFRCR